MADPFSALGWRGRGIRIQNRVQARLATRARVAAQLLAAPPLATPPLAAPLPAAGSPSPGSPAAPWPRQKPASHPPAAQLLYEPGPQFAGSALRGTYLMAGCFAFAGQLVRSPGRSVWTIQPPDAAFAVELQAFGWLDDLAAVPDDAAPVMARAWVADWIARFGKGAGPGWSPECTGPRLLRLICHAPMLLQGLEPPETAALLGTFAQQALFLARRHAAAPPGAARIEALVALIVAGAALHGMRRYVAPAATALAQHCAELIAPDGSIESRNPEALMSLFCLLTLAAQALGQTGVPAGAAHLAATARMAPTLRALRHAGGRLARFHGGGPGPEGRLDQALASAHVRSLPGPGPYMGFVRLSCGRTSVIVDAAAPPRGSSTAHASTLALELTSGRRPLVVNCGSGTAFGADWLRAGRETASHSTLTLGGQSSCRFAPLRGGEALANTPQSVTVQQASGPSGHSLIVGHDGYLASHGLTHVRRLNLSADGRALVGEDTLAALSETGRKRFGRLMNRSRSQGLAFAIRFHLHPDVAPLADPANGCIHLTLPSGEIWQFRQHGGAALALEPSVYLDNIRLKPRTAKQIVLSGQVIDYAAQVSWTLAKSRDTPQGLRDLESSGSTTPD